MLKLRDVIEMFRVPPEKKIKLQDYRTDWDGDDSLPEEDRRRLAAELLAKNVEELTAAQERLYAANSWSILCVFQAMDAAGKDGTIKHVMSGVNPQGVQVFSFKRPSAEELDHDFLWRCSKALPARGCIGIFNRSYYEEVLTVKVHPEFIANQRIPEVDSARKKFWNARYASINDFEQHLTRNGTRVIKFFLHVSKQEQKKRLLARINDPNKNWKFEQADLNERAHWNDYMAAFESMLRETSTKQAPWHVLPADNKWVCRALVAVILAHEISKLDLQFPKISNEQRQALLECQRRLESDDE